MRERETVRDVDGVAHGVGWRERPGALESLLQRSARQMLHDDERRAVDLADVVDRDDARMREGCERARFLREHAARLAVRGGLCIEDLDRDLTLEGEVLSEVDLGRAASPDRFNDLVALVQDTLHGELCHWRARGDYTVASIRDRVRERITHNSPQGEASVIATERPRLRAVTAPLKEALLGPPFATVRIPGGPRFARNERTPGP